MLHSTNFTLITMSSNLQAIVDVVAYKGRVQGPVVGYTGAEKQHQLDTALTAADIDGSIGPLMRDPGSNGWSDTTEEHSGPDSEPDWVKADEEVEEEEETETVVADSVEELQEMLSMKCLIRHDLRSTFEPIQRLGTGGQGDVIAVRHKTGGSKHQYYALKSYNLDGPRNRRAFENELYCLKTLRCSAHIAGCAEFIDRSGTVGAKTNLVLDIANSGDLSHLLERSAQMGVLLPENLVWIAFQQMLEAVAFVHANGVIHCDIKPNNWLVHVPRCGGLGGKHSTPRPKITLADFGCAKAMAGEHEGHLGESSKYSICGTYDHFPPECMPATNTETSALRATGDPARSQYVRMENTMAGDMWALGCCISALATGRQENSNGRNTQNSVWNLCTGYEDRLSFYTSWDEGVFPPSNERVPGADAQRRNWLDLWAERTGGERPVGRSAELQQVLARFMAWDPMVRPSIHNGFWGAQATLEHQTMVQEEGDIPEWMCACREGRLLCMQQSTGSSEIEARPETIG